MWIVELILESIYYKKFLKELLFDCGSNSVVVFIYIYVISISEHMSSSLLVGIILGTTKVYIPVIIAKIKNNSLFDLTGKTHCFVDIFHPVAHGSMWSRINDVLNGMPQE